MILEVIYINSPNFLELDQHSALNDETNEWLKTLSFKKKIIQIPHLYSAFPYVGMNNNNSMAGGIFEIHNLILVGDLRFTLFDAEI